MPWAGTYAVASTVEPSGQVAVPLIVWPTSELFVHVVYTHVTPGASAEATPPPATIAPAATVVAPRIVKHIRLNTISTPAAE